MQEKNSKKYLISTGSGLQDVDMLTNSTYYYQESKRYIDGKISIDELENVITSYYQNNAQSDDRQQEADIVAVRISKLIDDEHFDFSIKQFQDIHRYLFDDLMKNAGEFRTENLRKKEWVLDGDTVDYSDFRIIEDILEINFEEAKEFDYRNATIDELIDYLAQFTKTIWKNHPFREGNTRTTAVFLIKLLNNKRFEITNNMFANHSRYFRDALVRANYENADKKIYEDMTYLKLFLRNLLLNENNRLESKYLHVSLKGLKEDDRINRIIDIIKAEPAVTQNEIAKKTGLSLRTIKYIFEDLIKKDIVFRKGSKKKGEWIIKK